MARRFTRGRFTRPAPKTKRWLSGLTVDRQTIPSNTRILSLTLNAAGLLLRPFTVLRTRLEILWTSDQVAVTEMPFGAMGMAVVSEVASGVGATAIPDTIDDADFDWFVYQGLLSQITITGTVAGFQSPSGTPYTIDSKAMRKVGSADDVVVTVVNEDDSVGAELSMVGRMLVQLH